MSSSSCNATEQQLQPVKVTDLDRAAVCLAVLQGPEVVAVGDTASPHEGLTAPLAHIKVEAGHVSAARALKLGGVAVACEGHTAVLMYKGAASGAQTHVPYTGNNTTSSTGVLRSHVT